MLQRLSVLLTCLKCTQSVTASFCKLLDNAVTVVTAQEAYSQTTVVPLYLHDSCGQCTTEDLISQCVNDQRDAQLL